MKLYLAKLWDSLHSSYWFVPTVMATFSIALAFGTIALDRTGRIGPIENLGWIYTGGPEGARTLLSAVAGSMITVAGTTFSITLVALQLASSQFGPRLLRNFMQDTGNQIVLGTFIGTFIYCLLVMRTVRGEDYDAFVPQISVTVGIGLAITSIGVLIYFIHHVATSIQASHVISEVGEDLEKAIDRLFPTDIGQVADDERLVAEIPTDFDRTASTIFAGTSGYLQAIDNEKLMKIATENDLLVRLKYRPGNFIVKGNVLVMVWPPERLNKKLGKQIKQLFAIGKQRTEQQDIEFSINQLVEIAMRAISPGVNDPFTAIQCIDQLSAGLSHLAERDFPPPYRFDDEKKLRVIIQTLTFAEITNTAFNQIRQYSNSDVGVRIRLLEAISAIATHIKREKDRDCLLHHTDLIERASQAQISEESDRQYIQHCYHLAVKALRSIDRF